MGFFKSVIHSVVPKEIRNVVNTVTKPVEGFLHNAIPKEIRPFVQEPVEFLIGGKDLGDLNIVPREIKRAIPKEIHGLSGPELAAIAAGSYFGLPYLAEATGIGTGTSGSGSLLSLFGPGDSMWFGGSGGSFLPSGLSNLFSGGTLANSIGLTPGSLTSGAGGLAVNLPGAAGGGGGFLSSLSSAWPSVLGGSGSGLSSWILPAMGIGLGADLLGSYNKAKMEEKTKEALENATNRYVGEVTWTPEKRGEYMKGVQSELQTMLGGRRARSAANVAGRGIGGGEYGEQVDRAYSDAMGEAVKKLYSTYQPSNLSADVLKSWTMAASPTQSGGWRFLDSLANLAGSAGSQLLNWTMLKSILGAA